ncbi:serine/threonine-protein kinase HT1 [Aspergillus avenaceus]|uniref:Serine/threonine-protein kinase HT1 n=1 Tax=Aspergillus avenaceus TaxID=36643 RepID=A0A5N6TYH4_ASPAV|nr:serine/threonine-protein kinase HT1 [Aspergillus avenaceus]
MASSLFTDLNGQPIHDSQVLGYGRTGVVVRRGSSAVKIPLRHPWSTESDVQSNMEIIMREQGVYSRFNSFPKDQTDGIVPCLGLQVNATELAHMENGDLRTYLEKNQPSRELQMRWFRQMAQALEQVHAKCVIVADIATRNFLLDSELSVKICDFSEASLLPLDTDMETVDNDGFSIQTDIGQLGAVMYEVITQQKCDFDRFEDGIPMDGRAIWPRRTSLPSTEGLWLGEIVEKCWVEGGFRNAHALLHALRSADREDSTLKVSIRSYTNAAKKPMVMLSVVFGVLIIISAWIRNRS